MTDNFLVLETKKTDVPHQQCKFAFLATSLIPEIFSEVAQRGVTAEKVADNAIKQIKRYLASQAVISEHLADQILLPMLLGQGGQFITGELSQHTQTNINVINQLAGNMVSIKVLDNELFLISVIGLSKTM